MADEKALKKEGIGGWLGFYIYVSFVLGFMGFLNAAFVPGNVYDRTLNASVLLLHVITAYFLAVRQPRAVRWVKILLLAELLFFWAILINTSCGFLPAAEDQRDMILYGRMGSVAAQYVFFSALWYYYFSVSKRVQNTYPGTIILPLNPRLKAALFVSMVFGAAAYFVLLTYWVNLDAKI